jgi:pilus assembly protein Flp/PilA
MLRKAVSATRLAKKFSASEEGASLIEYSILIGLITAVILAIILAIGAWIGNAWQSLNVNLT